jgi:demethylmenaquinone methyltransferase/2-methoxy-6-polyprenyl-1,4-benzoquinol methylase/phosphoethanolamine N-methyltransferase
MSATENKFSADQSVLTTKGRPIRWANRYDGIVRLLTFGKDKALRESTADLAHIKPGGVVLDVGCGTGELTLAAKARAGGTGKVYGIDAASEMIAAARSKAARQGVDVDFRVDLVEALSFPDNTFDVVLSSLMMHHLPDDVKSKGLSEIYRVLKPGGHLLVVDVRRPAELHGRILMAFLLHPRIENGVDDLLAMMKAVGFSHIEAGGTGFLPMVGYVRGETGSADFTGHRVVNQPAR